MPNFSSTTITRALACSESSEDSSDEITTLILRSSSLSSFDHSLSQSLPKLTTLSLSHNDFVTLDNFSNLSSLVDLNMNFNKLNSDSVKALIPCKSLTKLYLSNNCISDAAFKHFPKMRALKTLCLFKNKLKFLMKAQNCVSAMENLEDVSFEGNPLSFEANYKYAIIRSCRRLKLMDGEEVTELDVDLGEMGMDEGDNDDNDYDDGVVMAEFTSDSSRATPKNNSSVNPNLKLKLNFSKASLTPKPHSTEMNTDPLLLTYRASAILNGENDNQIADVTECETDDIAALANEISANKKQSRSFVGKLRRSSVSKSGCSSTNNSRPSTAEGEKHDRGDDIGDAVKMLGLNLHSDEGEGEGEGENGGDFVVTNGDGDGGDGDGDVNDDDDDDINCEAGVSEQLDSSDPWEIIRKLIVKCETCESEMKMLRKHLAGKSSDDSVAEIKSLRKELRDVTRENKNMYLMSEENKRLKRELDELREENRSLRSKSSQELATESSARVPTLAHPDDNSSYNLGPRSNFNTWAVPYPEVGIPTPRSSENSYGISGSRPTSSQTGSRPASARSRESYGCERPKTAAERIEANYITNLRSEAGLLEVNPSDGIGTTYSDDEEDLEILNLMERNENELAKLRKDLVNCNKQFEEEENRQRAKNAPKVEKCQTKPTNNTSSGNDENKHVNNFSDDNATSMSTNKKLSVRELLDLRKREKNARIT